MEICNDEQSKEVLGAQAHIWNRIFNYIKSMALKAAIQLSIPDIIHNHGQPMKLSELIAALPINKEKSGCVYRLMRILVQSGFFIKKKLSQNGYMNDDDEEEGYLLTSASRLLLKDEPLSQAPFVMTVLDSAVTKPCNYVAEWLQNDYPTAFEMVHESSFWDYAGHNPSFNNLFNDGMASDTRVITSILVKDCGQVFHGLKSLVDVGGGTGTVSKAIADAYPDLNCTVLDLPQVVDGLVGSRNLSFVGGDMFKAIPHAHAILLKWILHDWNDEDCVKILKKCKEAIPSKEDGGKVIIIDMLVMDVDLIQKGDEKIMKTQLFFDMMMMILVRGKERTKKEWAKLFSLAGYTDYKVTPILGLKSLIEVFP